MARTALVAALIALLALSVHAGRPAHAGQPTWAQLSEQRRQVLAPLQTEWDRMEAVRKKKWLVIADRYPGMPPDEQARVRKRMKSWAALTPDQRETAREQYKILQKAAPERRRAIKEKWQEYRQLPPEEKQRLAEKARRKTGKAREAISGKPAAKPGAWLDKPDAASAARAAPPSPPEAQAPTPDAIGPGAPTPAPRLR